MPGAPRFTAMLFKYPGPGGWYFVAVPPEHCPTDYGDWGRRPVRATIDGKPHETSVWHGKDGRTLLPIPRRFRASKSVGAPVDITLRYPDSTPPSPRG